VDDVERQPAADEDGHHGDEHLVCTALASDLHFVPVINPKSYLQWSKITKPVIKEQKAISSGQS